MTARQAFDLYQAGRTAEAASLCERLVHDDPAATAAWHVLGVSRLALGLTAQALEALDHALALDPVANVPLKMALAPPETARFPSRV